MTKAWDRKPTTVEVPLRPGVRFTLSLPKGIPEAKALPLGPYNYAQGERQG